jgi:hypothetical protein
MNGTLYPVALARQEQYRAEAAKSRAVASLPTTPRRSILGTIARIVRASFEAPALAPGSIIPATH